MEARTSLFLEARTPLFFDCETTGIEPTARLVTIAWGWLSGNPYHVLIRATDFDISNSHIHGITTVASREFGTHTAQEILLAIRRLLAITGLVVAHNVDFDRRILDYEASLLGEAISWPATFCTMRALTPIMRLPARVGNGHKWPTLTEAYRFLFNREPEVLHCARTDMLACREIYLEGERRGYW